MLELPLKKAIIATVCAQLLDIRALERTGNPRTAHHKIIYVLRKIVILSNELARTQFPLASSSGKPLTSIKNIEWDTKIEDTPIDFRSLIQQDESFHQVYGCYLFPAKFDGVLSTQDNDIRVLIELIMLILWKKLGEKHFEGFKIHSKLTERIKNLCLYFQEKYQDIRSYSATIGLICNAYSPITLSWETQDIRVRSGAAAAVATPLAQPVPFHSPASITPAPALHEERPQPGTPRASEYINSLLRSSLNYADEEQLRRQLISEGYAVEVSRIHYKWLGQSPTAYSVAPHAMAGAAAAAPLDAAPYRYSPPPSSFATASDTGTDECDGFCCNAAGASRNDMSSTHKMTVASCHCYCHNHA